MNFLNFGLFPLLASGALAAAFTVALYLFDRSRRRVVVSTLRFWNEARQPQATARRRKVSQPMSLILQLAGTLLLLTAIAAPRFGGVIVREPSDVLILGTSGSGAVLTKAKARAIEWLRRLPSNERVMLIRADGVPTAATAFESAHAEVRRAIESSSASPTALDLNAAIDYAREAQRAAGSNGEIVFVGATTVRDVKSAPVSTPEDFRAIPIEVATQHTPGIRRISVHRTSSDRGEPAWETSVTVHNYSPYAARSLVAVAWNGAPAGTRAFTLAGRQDHDEKFTLRGAHSGKLTARLMPSDGFAGDDHAELNLSGGSAFPLIVYTRRAEVLRPLIAANPLMKAEFRSPESYRADANALVILDEFSPPQQPRGPAIWINPPASASPVYVTRAVSSPHNLRWLTDSPMGSGLRGHDASISQAETFRPGPNDMVVAASDEGPILIARATQPKAVVIGFDPAAPGTRFELATPLMFANALRWTRPEAFRPATVTMQPAGSLDLPLNAATQPSEWRVTQENQKPVPFTMDSAGLHIFSGSAATIHVTGPDRDAIYALTLPDPGEYVWTPPAAALRPFRHSAIPNSVRDLWPYLAVIGTLCLAVEWLLFARARRLRRVAATPATLRKAS